MKIVKGIKPSHVDERGYIAHLLDDGKSIVKSVLMIESKKGAVRANHYHKRDAHWCYFLKGSMEYVEDAIHPRPGSRTSAVIETGDMVYTPALLPHAMRFLEDSTFLVFAAESRHQLDYEEDTVRVKLI